ncbi:hypothetical protein SEA_TYPHA_71 [Mycobacterium phage Typha]|uniref:Uncharacterized protein n=1 Tax=Mycobacterium phage Typha TaxID=2517971 RepID=A0A482JDK7_9CAUD|nr:hypothetical protein KCH40_gp098 [Mycobacterium phage Typha]QBP29726.1 hypothetical protein SEA_TYPHA_71 [Mycobacterium phage Typha]
MSTDISGTFDFGGRPYHLLGYTDPEGVQRAVVTDGDEMWSPVASDGGQWVAICDGCPTTWNADYGYHKKLEWAFPGTEEGRQMAEDFAVRHHGLQGHKVNVVTRTEFTFKLYGDDNPALSYLLPDGDQ